MPPLRGTRVYWKPSDSNTGNAPTQILKNSGYISVVLQAVQYKAKGNWWQGVFGGSDKITVSTQVKWQTSTEDVKTAAAIQDLRKVSVPSINPLAIGRNIVLKVPAVADGVELQVGITAIHDDNLGKTLQLLNSDDFKQPLQLAPVAVGQILTIANLVKKVFSDMDPSQILQASYPGIISEGQIADPVANNRLVEGYIILIVKQDDEDRLDFDPAQMAVTGNGLQVGGQPISNTYMVYNVTFDKWRGRNTGSAWSKKFDQSSSKADELMFSTAEQRQNIISAAYDLLKEAGALLDADDNYIPLEKINLKKAAFQEVKDKIAANADGTGGVVHLVQMNKFSFAHIPEGIVNEDLSDEQIRSDVTSYAHDLANQGLNLGFNFRVDM